jgi:mono/diheme cytochrome c family protein
MRRAFTFIFAALMIAFIARTVEISAQAKKPAVKASAVKNPVASTPDSIAMGQAMFKKYCRFCHGDDAKGNGPQAPKDTHPPDLTDAKWDHGSSDADIFEVIKNGVGPKFDMKAYAMKMTDQDIWNVVNYVRSLGPKDAKR